MERRCESCEEAFVPHPAVRGQSYCSREACQRERKKRWQAVKMATDVDYRQNQAAAQRAWRERNPGYWRDYRVRNPVAAERNRQGQRERNRKRRGGLRAERVREGEGAELGTLSAGGGVGLIVAGSGGGGVIAKMDELLLDLVGIQRVGLDALASAGRLQRWTSYLGNGLWFHDLRFLGAGSGVIAKRGRAGLWWRAG